MALRTVHTRRQFVKTMAAAPAGAAALPAAAAGWRERFGSPGRNERPLTWYFPSSPDAGRIRADLAELRKLGLGGICIMPATSTLRVPYLSEEFWETIRLTVEEAVRQGFRVWLYDELDYPSTSAGGETIRRHPEYVVTGLEHRETAAKGGEPVDLPMPAGEMAAAVAERPGSLVHLKEAISGGRLRWQAPPGDWTIHTFSKKVGDPLSTIAKGRAGLVRPLANLLDANAVREFISNTYEGYARVVGRHFGKTIEAMFTDEPCLHTAGYWNFGEKAEDHRPLLPWVDGFAEYFQWRKGYDLLPLLPCLVKGAGAETAKVRCDYWEVVCDLIVESYYEPLADWCARNKIAFSGHQLLEEGLLLHLMFSGSLFRNASRMHIPGMDLIGPRPEGVSLEDTMTRAGGPYVGKILSSAAHTRGRSEVMSESFAASGFEMTLEKIVAIANWQFATGVTELMPMGRHHIPPRKQPPESDLVKRFYEDEFFKDPSFYGTYIGRCKALLSGGVHVADIAMLVPEVSIWANYTPAEVGLPYEAYRRRNPEAVRIDDAFIALSMELLRNQLDYDYLDDEGFLKAEIDRGRLRLAGETYRLLVMPEATTMRYAAAAKIAEFRRSGGRVVACGALPHEAMERGQDKAVREALGGLNPIPVREAPRAIRAGGNPDIFLAAADSRIYYIHKRRGAQDIYFLVNMADSARAPAVTFHRMKGPAVLCDPRTGEITPVKAAAAGTGVRLQVDLEKLSAMFVVFG